MVTGRDGSTWQAWSMFVGYWVVSSEVYLCIFMYLLHSSYVFLLYAYSILLSCQRCWSGRQQLTTTACRYNMGSQMRPSQVSSTSSTFQSLILKFSEIGWDPYPRLDHWFWISSIITVHFANTCFSLGADTGYWAEHTVNLQKPNLNLESQLISLALSWNWFPVGHAGLDACCFSPWISCCGESSWGVARVGGPRKRRKCKFMFKVGIHFFKPYYFAFKLLVSSVLYFRSKSQP